jgi:D-methionine transport system ATP-binding protein
MAMIELINVSKTYHTNSGVLHALKKVNLTVPKGEIYGVIGKSGAGKSTLIRCVNFLEQPTSGSVKIDGKDLSTLTPAGLRATRHDIGMIFQHFNLLSQRTVYQNVALPLELMGQNQSQINETVPPLLALTGLSEKANNYPSELSGGQKQRVAIARAMASKPKVLLCDEATSALDQHTTQSILQLLKEINQKMGLTILLITHEIDVVKQICDHVALINNGELVEQDEVFEFFTKPKTSLAQDFVKSSLKHDLPAALQHQFMAAKSEQSNVVLRIIFHGKAAAEPLIAHLMQDFGIRLNILQANIEFLKKDTLGIMITEVISHTGNLSEGISYLQQQDVNVEIIGYVNRHAE